MFTQAVLLALSEIRRNWLRSLLTVLGIVIGVASVVAMVTLGQGATKRITSEISELGGNMLFVYPEAESGGGFWSSSMGAPFKMRDVEAIFDEISGVRHVSPVSAFTDVAVNGNRSWSTEITGAANGYFFIRNFRLGDGRLFSATEERAGQPVVVIGDKVREKLFPDADPVGGSVRLGDFSYTVIGVLQAKGKDMLGQDQDNVMVMPMKALQRRVTGNRNVDFILVSMHNPEESSRVKDDITKLLRERRRIPGGKKNDFTVEDMEELIRTVGRTAAVLTAFLGAIAAVSLLVGGIGIMNIMLVSVTERTREIGIRMAVGAQERDILLQFLVEAATVSVFGGLIGILLGLGVPLALCPLLKVPFVFDWRAVVGSVLFSGFIGICFGFFPARRAAALDPIEALRHE
ncbi:ABC transporter permease [Salidesulfovibrio onnuriiensis]|uniref:ABC transporter permease n=1 Tax=Salidesulfovibrio onnuriiensis TaxID=2583823 RepID=UPI0011C7DD41|nr:ABC transporter permease [Salidesulfovibrio onnuriiensis]